MRRLLWTAAAIVATAATATAHANSVSYAEFTIDPHGVHASVRLPLDDVDLLLRLDRDLDGQVSAAELDAARSAIRAYVTKHLQVRADDVAVDGTLDRVGVWRDAAAFLYVESELSYRASRTVGEVTIRSDFLTELYPSHKTIGRISFSGGEERFTFDPASTYRRRVTASRATTAALVLGGMSVLALLVIIRRRSAAVAIALLLAGTAAHADVIMSAPALNATLKTMEKWMRQSEAGPGRAEALFQLGAEADGLASIMNAEVESHGMQERELLDLALSRTKELGVGIAYNREKKKFFYDGGAFAAYLRQAPRGTHAAAAEFKLLSYQFYQSSGADAAALSAAARAKQRFLARYPGFEARAELQLYLAVDYRDLHRLYLDAHDAANAAAFRQRARAQCLQIARQYPRTEQADAARQLLRALEAQK